MIITQDILQHISIWHLCMVQWSMASRGDSTTVGYKGVHRDCCVLNVKHLLWTPGYEHVVHSWERCLEDCGTFRRWKKWVPGSRFNGPAPLLLLLSFLLGIQCNQPPPHWSGQTVSSWTTKGNKALPSLNWFLSGICSQQQFFCETKTTLKK